MNRLSNILTLLVFMNLTFGAALWTPARADESPLPNEEECLVCGRSHNSADYSIEYKGRKFHLCSRECRETYQALALAGDLDKITSKIEPRSALFQQDSNPREQLSNVYLFGGLYVLLGLVFGGLASYMAVQKGLSGWSAFTLGLAFNVIGLAIAMSKAKQEMLFTSEGLTKIPSTRAEVSCDKCGHANHPAAQSCSQCGCMLSPKVASEVTLAGLSKEA